MAKTTVIVECDETSASFTIENHVKIRVIKNCIEGYDYIEPFAIPMVSEENKARLIATIMAYNSKHLLAKTNEELRDEMLKIMKG